MKVTGKIVNLFDTVQVSDKFKKRELWIETTEQYPQTLNVQLSQDKCDQVNFGIGDMVELNINLRGRTWTGATGETKCFNTIECWSWTKQETQAAPQSTAVPNTPVGHVEDLESDLPF